MELKRSLIMGKWNTNRSKKKEICGGSGEAQPTGKKRNSKGTLMDKDVNAKRSKRDPKSSSSQSLEWNDEDEIDVLHGMIDFRAETGKNPFDDEKKTYEFIQGYITFEDYSYEFVEKMRNLKKKLMAEMKKANDPSSLEHQDPETYEMLKLILGYDEEPKEEKQVITDEGGKWYENAAVVRQIVSYGVDEDSLIRKWASVPKEKKNTIDQMWSVLRAKELESISQKAEFLYELVSVIVQASSSL